MKKTLMFISLAFVFFSCKKNDDPIKGASFKKIIYEIRNNEDSLAVAFRRGVYTSDIKGNIEYDTVFFQKSTFYINAEVLIGKMVIFNGYNTKGSDFHLKIKDENGNVLVETDTIAHYPANLLHPDQYISYLEYMPQ